MYVNRVVIIVGAVDMWRDDKKTPYVAFMRYFLPYVGFLWAFFLHASVFITSEMFAKLNLIKF